MGRKVEAKIKGISFGFKIQPNHLNLYRHLKSLIELYLTLRQFTAKLSELAVYPYLE